MKFHSQMRFWGLTLLLAALLLRGLIPVGYMPDFGARAGMMQIRICTGDGFANIVVPAGKYSAHGKTAPTQHHQNSPCDFAINHTFGWLAAPAITLAILSFAFLILFAAAEFSFAPRRYFGASAPRAPPIFS